MSEQDELIAAAELGEESRRFLDSDLGRCILGMAAQEVTAAQKEFGKTDPTDTKAIIALQNKIWCGEHFEQWLHELLDDGESAINVFKQSQQIE